MIEQLKLANCVSGLALCLGITVTAQAQSANPAPAPASRDTAEVSDIIVTARRIEERLQDVPISITVFSQDQLANRNVVNAEDLATFTPSLSVNSNFGSENSSFAIRGFVQDIGTPPSVGVYFADVVAPRASAPNTPAGNGAGPGNFFDLQNVQVLKGPQGTLFGRNTTGGAVLFVPQKPTTRLEGYLEGSIGDYGMRRIQGVLNIPLGEQAGFRIGVDHQQRDGYLKNDSGVGPKDLANLNYTAVRASLVVDLLPSLENYTIVSYLHSANDGSAQKLIACAPGIFVGFLACDQLANERAKGAGFFTVQNGIADPHSTLNQWQTINTTTWQPSHDLTIKNIASYAQLHDSLKQTFSGVDWSFFAPGLIFAAVAPIPGHDSSSESTVTEELQLQGSAFAGRLSYQTGAYLEVSNPLGASTAQSQFVLACPGGTADPATCSDAVGMFYSSLSGYQEPVHVGAITYVSDQTSFRDVGTYAQTTYKLTEALRLTGGVRYTWDRQTSDTERVSYSFPVVPPFTGGGVPSCTDAISAPSCSQSQRQQSSRPTWLIDLDYKPNGDILVYGKYARGYRAGGIFPSAPSDYRVFGPEKVDAYELGLKSTINQSLHATFDVAGFYNNFTDQQLMLGFSPAPGSAAFSTTGVVNAGRSRIYGAEVESSIRPFAGLALDASYTYLNATIRSIAPIVSTDPNYVVDAQIVAGNRLALSPRGKFAVSAVYTLPFSAQIGVISIGATVTHTSSQLTNYVYQDPAVRAAFGGADYGTLAPVTLLSLSAEWRSVGGLPVDLSAFATNVTNREYYTFIPGLGTAGLESAQLGEPRMYGLRLRYTFGR